MVNNNMLSMTCEKCGGQLELDLDNLQKYCNHCGGRIMVDPAAFKDVLLERERTKQAEIYAAQNAKAVEQARREWEAQELRHSRRNMLTLILGVLGMALFVVGGVAGELSGPKGDWWYLIAFAGMMSCTVAGVLALITLISNKSKR